MERAETEKRRVQQEVQVTSHNPRKRISPKEHHPVRMGGKQNKELLLQPVLLPSNTGQEENKMKVIVAVARKLLVAVWHVIHDETDYVDFQQNKIVSYPPQTDEYDIPPVERLLSL